MMTLTLLFSPISHFPEAKEKDPVEEIGKLWLQAEQRHNIREKFANFGKRVEAGTDFSNYLSRERELCVCVCCRSRLRDDPCIEELVPSVR